jgi:hypothetical protein
MKPSPKSDKKPTTKKAELTAPIKSSSMKTTRLATNHNETLVRL